MKQKGYDITFQIGGQYLKESRSKLDTTYAKWFKNSVFVSKGPADNYRMQTKLVWLMASNCFYMV